MIKLFCVLQNKWGFDCPIELYFRAKNDALRYVEENDYSTYKGARSYSEKKAEFLLESTFENILYGSNFG